ASQLLAVQDELGVIYRLDITNGQVKAAIDFWKDGDYEGIEVVGDDIWVVKSTGTLYCVQNAGTPQQLVLKYNGFLSRDNDVEGLTYDPNQHRLLIACKSYVAEFYELRSLFAFDLPTKTFVPDPVFSIGRDDIKAYLSQCPKSRKHDKIVSFIYNQGGYALGPSAVAIHPKSGQLFVTSSAGRLIVILSPQGEIRHVRRLDKDFYPQPEGLAFAPDGTLYISTEAKNGAPARIYRIAYQPGFSDL
ncbi:MAG: SdiA-regulated domain-containing protein, partial [Bacteroidota bacterium]